VRHYWVSIRGCQDRCARCDVLRFETNCPDCLQSDIDKKVKLREDCMTPEADTPHPPPPPPPPSAPDALNRQIARLRGWTDFQFDGEDPFSDTARAPGSQQYDFVPNYAGDPAAALSLLEHVCKTDKTWRAELVVGDWNKAERYCRIHHDDRVFVGRAATFQEAIALAARDVLNALEGDRDDGTN